MSDEGDVIIINKIGSISYPMGILKNRIFHFSKWRIHHWRCWAIFVELQLYFFYKCHKTTSFFNFIFTTAVMGDDGDDHQYPNIPFFLNIPWISFLFYKWATKIPYLTSSLPQRWWVMLVLVMSRWSVWRLVSGQDIEIVPVFAWQRVVLERVRF